MRPSQLNDDGRRAFANFAPLVLLSDAGRWPKTQRDALLALVRAKAAGSELDYIRLLAAHRPLCRTLLAQ